MTTIEIPNSVTSIGHYTFEGCTSLTSIKIPNSVTSIGDGTFGGCTSLTSIEIPNSVTSIGDGTFDGCTSLNSIEIPNSVTSIGDGTFYGCTRLTSIEIPNSVTNIGHATFLGCNSLVTIEIPNSVTSIGDRAFNGCIKLIAINILSNPHYHSSDGVLYTKDMKVLIKMLEGKSGEYIVPSETEIIGVDAFWKSALEIVRLCENIREIKDCAFEDASIQELHIRHEHPENLEIGDNAFKGLKNCTLYVPIGTGYAYRHHPAFAGKFKEVIIER